MNNSDKRITVNVNEEIRDRLKMQAIKENRTISNLAKIIILKYLEENQSK